MSTLLDLDTTVPVLLLKTDPCIVHHGAVGVARRLGALGVPVYATVEDRYTPLANCRYLTGAFVNRTNNAGEFLNFVAAIAQSINRPTILLPTDDGAAVFVSEHAKRLRNWFLFPHLPTGLARRLADKSSLYALCRSIGISCPESMRPTSLGQVHEFIGRAKFPVAVKAAEHSQRLNNHCSSVIVRSPQQLLDFCGCGERIEATNVILQEYVPGEDWIFHGYLNPQTDCFIGFTGKKLRSYPPSAGPTTLGVSVPNEALCSQAEATLRAIGYSGIVDLDYRRDERDGCYTLLDFNPRVGANFRMFEDAAGIDVVRALHLDLLGRAAPRKSPMIQGRIFVVEPHDLFASFGHLRRGELTLKSWRQSLSGRRELAWWSLEDPLPFFVMSARLFLRVARRAFRAGLEMAKALRRLPRRGGSSAVMREKLLIEEGVHLGQFSAAVEPDRDAFPSKL